MVKDTILSYYKPRSVQVKKENNHNGYDYIYVNKYTIRMESSIKKF